MGFQFFPSLPRSRSPGRGRLRHPGPEARHRPRAAKTTLTASLLALAIATPAHGATYVEGAVSGTWTPAGNPYLVVGDVTVLSPDTLRIEPGVDVQFMDAWSINVRGVLLAEGTETDSILFRPDPSGIEWGGIRFVEAADGSSVRFCDIWGTSKAGNTFPEGCGGGIYSEFTNLVIANCSIHECRVESFYPVEDGGGGIFCLGGSVEIRDSRIWDCVAMAFCTLGGGGIGAREAELLITGNEIRDCHAHGLGGGIMAGASHCLIEHNIIWQCSGFHYGGGIGLVEGCSGRIFDNLILSNQVDDLYGGGIYTQSSPVEILFNTLCSNSTPLHEYGSGGGLYAGGEPPVVLDGIFWSNLATFGPQIYPTNLPTVGWSDIEGGYPGEGNFNLDPAFTTRPDAPDHPGYFLSCVAAGQAEDSPCLNAGDRTASAAGLDDRTTRTDYEPDDATADLGYHHLIPVPVMVHEPTVRGPLTGWACPNPLMHRTRISIPGAQGALEVVDLRGRRIALLPATNGGPEGMYWWDGRRLDGRRVASGVYFVREIGPGGRDVGLRLTVIR